MLQRHEKDPETLKAIEHLMEHFNWCFTTRNLVLMLTEVHTK